MDAKGLEKIKFSGKFSGKRISVQPGDLSKFVPQGTGVYGYQKNCFHPIKGDPVHEESGGFVYFGNGVTKRDFYGFLRMMDVDIKDKDYAAFICEAENPAKDRYFSQMRIVSKFGLQFMFGALDSEDYAKFEKQKSTIGEALWSFMEFEKSRWGTDFGDPKIKGKFGGHGDYAQEELSFGFMLENNYHNVYRIWSKAWLVTK